MCLPLSAVGLGKDRLDNLRDGVHLFCGGYSGQARLAHRVPEIPLQVQPNIADNFVKDVLTYKIRHIDHLYGATVAGTRLRSELVDRRPAGSAYRTGRFVDKWLERGAGNPHDWCSGSAAAVGLTPRGGVMEPGDKVGPDGTVYRNGPFGWRPAPNPNGPGLLRNVDPFGRPLIERGPFGQPVPDPSNPFGGPRDPMGNPLGNPSNPFGGPGGGGPGPGWGGPG